MKKYEDYEPISGEMMCLAIASVFCGAIYFGAFDKKEQNHSSQERTPKLIEKQKIVSPLNEITAKERGN